MASKTHHAKMWGGGPSSTIQDKVYRGGGATLRGFRDPHLGMEGL